MADLSNENNSHVPVNEFYNGKSLFVTGGTGFLGKVLIEKLLWSCPGIKNIYVLIRPKKTKSVTTRLAELLDTPAFNRLRESRQSDLQKIIPVEGDILMPLLGINQNDIDVLTRHVSVVFHGAAFVRFDADLKTAVSSNVVSTKMVLNLCHQMKKLEAFVHISTAYSFCIREEVEECVYPTSRDPEKIIQLIEILDDDLISVLSSELTGKYPNTYAFSKGLAENIVLKKSAKLPTAIVRPSIVAASIQEPIPGWIDNWSGATALSVFFGKGILRSLHCHGNKVADLIPIDMAVNLMICVAWHIATSPPIDAARVYNCCSGPQNPITWKQYIGHLTTCARRRPLKDCFLYPWILLPEQSIWNKIFTFIFETLPSRIVDFCYVVMGRNPVLGRMSQKLERMKEQQQYMTTNEWHFKNENVQSLLDLLQDEDQQTFPFSVREIHWPSYVECYFEGVRKFLLKEK